MTWVKGRAGIRRWVGPRPIDEVVADRAVARKARPRLVIVKQATTTCDDCGCLILTGERCPACLVWAERNVVAASWAADITPITTEMRAA